MDGIKVRKQVELLMREMEKLLAMVAPPSEGIDPEVLEKIQKRICLVCGEPLLESDAVTRNAHHRCYRRLIRDKVDLDVAESKGLIGPKGTAGRRSTPLPDDVKRKLEARDKRVKSIEDDAIDALKKANEAETRKKKP